MTLQIEEGKFYKTRDGRKVGPVRRSRDYEYPWRGDVDANVGLTKSWSSSGVFHLFSDDPKYTALDIVAEWVDEPPAEEQAVDINQMLYGDDPNRVTKQTVLETALQTVADRGVPYGGVEDNFNRIARLWNAHLLNRYSDDRGEFDALPTLDASDVAMMMALMKIARLQGNPGHADSWVDVAGYAACGGEIGAKLTVDKPSEL